MPKPYKVVVTGPFNAGKTTFVNTLCHCDTVTTDKATRRPVEARVKPTTTVALDYGQVKLRRNLTIHLFGTPGQQRFDFMRDLLADGMHGFIFLIDSTDHRSLKPASELLTLFRQRSNVPYLLVANKADQPGLSPAEIRAQVRLAEEQPIITCIATDERSVRAVVERLVGMMEGR